MNTSPLNFLEIRRIIVENAIAKNDSVSYLHVRNSVDISKFVVTVMGVEPKLTLKVTAKIKYPENDVPEREERLPETTLTSYSRVRKATQSLIRTYLGEYESCGKPFDLTTSLNTPDQDTL